MYLMCSICSYLIWAFEESSAFNLQCTKLLIDMNIIILKINDKVSSVVLFLWIKCKKVSHTMAFYASNIKVPIQLTKCNKLPTQVPFQQKRKLTKCPLKFKNYALR